MSASDTLPPCPVCGRAPVITRKRLACWAQIKCDGHFWIVHRGHLGGPSALEVAKETWRGACARWARLRDT